MCMIVKIDKLSHEMRGIAKIDNKVTFVDKVIPNEVVNIRIMKGDVLRLYRDVDHGSLFNG